VPVVKGVPARRDIDVPLDVEVPTIGDHVRAGSTASPPPIVQPQCDSIDVRSLAKSRRNATLMEASPIMLAAERSRHLFRSAPIINASNSDFFERREGLRRGRYCVTPRGERQ
jgi:hypothetical protein